MIIMIIVEKILKSVLLSLYQYIFPSILLSVLMTYSWKRSNNEKILVLLRQWLGDFGKNREFRKKFYLFFYISMILFRTIFYREIWVNPLCDVLGTWGLYNSKGELYTDNIENLMLFVPFALLLMWNLSCKYINIQVRMFCCIKYSFAFSVGIELFQLLFHAGTFQISDIVFNTLGGLTGGVLYLFLRKLGRWKR